jgi:hypothetical protein
MHVNKAYKFSFTIRLKKSNYTQSLGTRELESQEIITIYDQLMVEFDLFLNNFGLVDMPLIGRQFTWLHPNGVSMSRLDGLLISSNWFDVWGASNVWVLTRDVSDHCPLVLRYSPEDWGPKPFRFNNFWLLNNDFKNVVTNAWRSHQCEGWMGFILKERLKNLKGVIKEWSNVWSGG